MDDLQLNITVTKEIKKKNSTSDKNVSGYKFASKPNVTGKIIARKRPHKSARNKSQLNEHDGEPQQKLAKPTEITQTKNVNKNNFASSLQDLSENKGKFQGKNYQDLSDDIQLKQKVRSGGWISSLFKNNPDVPRIGQRAVRPLVEKVFAGKTFSDLDIHPHSVANLQQNLSLKEVMAVQQQAVPIILEGRDVLIRSQTGSGKTLAYALPIIEALQAIRPKINRHDGLKVLVVVPTRELAVQTYELFIKLVKPFTWIVPGLLSGGQKRKAEKARLRKGLSILVGTPGRINDHLRQTQCLNFSKTGCLILDEADRLLDMGYEKDVAAIVKAIEDHKKAATYDPLALVKQTFETNVPTGEETQNRADTADTSEEKVKHRLTEVFLSKERQTILLSATLSKAVENLAGITMVDPVFIDTSEGRAIVADSLKPNQINETKLQGLGSSKTKKSLLTQSKSNVNQDKIEENMLETKDKAVSEDSDSDSDYEYFKEQKKLESNKNISEDNHEEVTSSHIGNTFNDALKNAMVEDEMILPATVNQTFLIVPMKLRLVTLCALIVEHCVLNKKGGKMIVFMATLEMVDYHSDLLETAFTGKDVKVKKKGGDKNQKSSTKKKKTSDGADNEDKSSDGSDSEFEAEYEAPAEGGIAPVEVEMFSLHGSMPHEQRMEVFKQFRVARSGVLICTDVAARGLDVPRVDLVLQYCAPASATDYVHRVGRTGRAAHVGAAVMFLLPSEAEFVRHLEQKRIRLRQTDESKPLESLRVLAPNAGGSARAAIALQTRLENIAHTNKEWLARASRAYTSWVRFYSGYPREVRQWLDAKQLHLGHAAKAFALRDTPAALARRAKTDTGFDKERPTNRLTLHDQEEKKRPGFSKLKIGSLSGRSVSKQSSMHTASEFDSGLSSVATDGHKKKKKNKQ